MEKKNVSHTHMCVRERERFCKGCWHNLSERENV